MLDDTIPAIAKPLGEGGLNWHPVNRALNNPRNEGAELLEIRPVVSAETAVRVQIVKDVKGKR
jgi:hypothetical protein